MALLTKFFRRTSSKPRTILNLDRLEARDVPAATVDLSTVGSSGAIGGALFRQYDAHAAHTGNVSSFLRLDGGGREQGYNTDARPLQFDESRNRNFTHSIRVADLPMVTINNVQYRELVLDVNEPNRHSQVSLDALRLYVSNDPKLHGYNPRTGTLGGHNPSYDMGAHRWVKIDAGLNHEVGTGDVLVDIPASALTGGTYLTLYSKFGTHIEAGGAFEQWGPGFKTATQTSSISGYILLDSGAGPMAPTFDTTVTLSFNGVVVQTITVAANSDGSYTFNIPLNQSGTYTLKAVMADGSSVYQASELIVNLASGDHLTGQNLTFFPNG